MTDIELLIKKTQSKINQKKNEKPVVDMTPLTEVFSSITKIKGKSGYTPVKGIDYFDGKDGKDGKDGAPGKDGKNGKDGYTPIKGKDYFDGKDGKDGKDGSPDTPYEIRDKLTSLRGRERLDAKAIKNLDKYISVSITDISSKASGSVGIETDPIYMEDKENIALKSEIPTNTNELTNGAGFITIGDIPAIPEDISDLTDTTNLLGNATSLQGVGITETDPTDGKILVYRTASNAYVLEDKPAAGANPSAADVAFTPAGDLAADDVQEALVELDTEKATKNFVIAMAIAL